MTKTRLIVLASFLVAFAAGIVAGAVIGRTGAGEHRHSSWLGQELDLTQQQREQMREIWSGVMSTSRQQQREQREALRQERDEAIRALFAPEQAAKYDAILATYAKKSAALDEQRRALFQQAVARTKEILTEEQRTKYDEMMRQRAERGAAHRRRGGERPDTDAAPSSPELRPGAAHKPDAPHS